MEKKVKPEPSVEGKPGLLALPPPPSFNLVSEDEEQEPEAPPSAPPKVPHKTRPVRRVRYSKRRSVRRPTSARQPSPALSTASSRRCAVPLVRVSTPVRNTC